MNERELERAMRGLKDALGEAVMELTPGRAPEEPVDCELVTLDQERDNRRWLAYLTDGLKNAKTFELHCWNEETEWISLALRYGRRKDSDWRHGIIVTGDVTAEFADMLLGQPKPAGREIYNKMTPFFNVFLDDRFHSSHYGTELYISP